MSLQLREFRLIFEGVREGVLALDDGGIRDANPAFCALLGYSHSQLLRLHPVDLAAPDLRKKLRTLLSESTSGSVPMRTIDFTLMGRRGELVPVSLRLIQTDGCWFLFAQKAVDADTAEVDAHALGFRGGTDRENRYHQLVEHLADGLVTLSGDGRLVLVNRAFNEMLGVRGRSRLVSRPLLDLVVERDRARVRRGLARWSKDTPSRFEASLLHTDGREVPVLLSGRMLERDDGRKGGAVVLVTDFAERRALLDRLALARQMEALSSLAGGIAHDFNNLLTGILGHASAIRSAPDRSDEVDDAARGVEESAELAARLTQRLLALVRGQAPHRRLLDVSELVRQTLRLLERVIPERVSVKTDFEERLPPVLADESQLQQAILNLCINARDAMVGHRGGGTLQITVRSGLLSKPLDDGGLAEEPAVELLVADDGPGIPEHLRSRIFDPFFTTKGLGRGMGLGLSSVYHLVDAHGGTVDVGSAARGGALFTLRLPAHAGRAVSTGPRLTPVDPPPVVEGGTVLVAEDEAAIRKMVATALRRQGYAVLTAEDGKVALELWGHHKQDIDALVLDVRMPHVDGTEVLREVRKERPLMPAVLSSGYIPEEHDDDEPPARVIYLPKPYRIPELLLAVEQAIELDSADGSLSTGRASVPTYEDADEATAPPGQGFDPARTLTDAEMPSVLSEIEALLAEER